VPEQIWHVGTRQLYPQAIKVFTVKVFICSLNFKKLHFSSSERIFVVGKNEIFDEKWPKSVHAVNTFQAAGEHF
jgi:hypothetical protein